MCAKQSAISRADQWAAETSSCQDCKVTIDGISFCTHLFKDMPDKKTFIFYERAASREKITIGSSSSVNAGVSMAGPSIGASGSGSKSVTTNIGDYMIKMLRKDGEGYRCVKCFCDKHPTLLKSVALSVKGKAWLINSDVILNPASYGDISGW